MWWLVCCGDFGRRCDCWPGGCGAIDTHCCSRGCIGVVVLGAGFGAVVAVELVAVVVGLVAVVLLMLIVVVVVALVWLR